MSASPVWPLGGGRHSRPSRGLPVSALLVTWGGRAVGGTKLWEAGLGKTSEGWQPGCSLDQKPGALILGFVALESTIPTFSHH